MSGFYIDMVFWLTASPGMVSKLFNLLTSAYVSPSYHTEIALPKVSVTYFLHRKTLIGVCLQLEPNG